MLRKLKSKKGESLVESLCAILIFTMASIVLFSMVSAAGDINGKAKIMDRENQEQMIAVEKGLPESKNPTTPNVSSGTVTVILGEGATAKTIANVEVDVYGGEGGSLFAYYVHPTEPAGG